MPETEERRPGDGAASLLRRAHDSTNDTEALTLPALLEILGHRDDEHVAVCTEPPGGVFSAAVIPAGAAPAHVTSLGDRTNVWFSVNPTRGPRETGRGGEADVTRLAALYADLDVKPGACRDLSVAEAIITEISAHLGQRPSAVVFSGHGLQPHWPIHDGEITDRFTTAAAKSLLGRFGRLVAIVAEHHGAAVDSVFDLARVLRVPGTTNMKFDPVPVTGRRDVGGPLSRAEVDERLTELGIDGQPDDGAARAEVSPPSGWTFAESTCSYVQRWIAGLSADGPKLGGGRNPWAASQMVRLACAMRLGCISEADTRSATTVLETRLATLLATTEPRRALRKLEMRDLARLGHRRAAEKTDDGAWAELGHHLHYGDEPGDFWGLPPGSSPPNVPIVEPAPDSVAVTALSSPPAPSPVVDGAAFILDQPDTIPAIWGRDNQILWAAGESLMIAGGQGLGKTTLAGMLVRALICGGDVLGLPVQCQGRSVLYLAMDRPRQIARSMARQFGEHHRDALHDLLQVHRGPPPADLAKNPNLLKGMADYYGGDIVIVDSLKDAAVGLSDDEVGAAYNRARQTLLASGRECVEVHHMVKRNANGGAPITLADVYGSVWLTAGSGSVILLTGEPGDPIVGLRHLKQPADEVGPWRLFHDQGAGQLTVDHEADLVAMAKASGAEGLTANAAAKAIFDQPKPSRADVAKARRRLDKLTAGGQLVAMEGARGAGRTTVWFPA